MKKFIICLTTSFLCYAPCFAESVTENISSSLKANTYEPNYFSIVLSLVFVVFLIYVTGILYTKLNKVGIKTLKNELRESSDIKPIILSTTPIGHDKTLQVIEINGEKLLIGVAQNSVNLIKTLEKEEKEKRVQEQQVQTAEPMDILYQNKQTEENKTKEKHTVNADDFGLYKKYLR